MAMAVLGLPLATQGRDVFVPPRLENLQARERALSQLLEDANIEQIDSGELKGVTQPSSTWRRAPGSPGTS